MADITLEWDFRKADANLRKHGISFDLAGHVFEDRFHVEIEDAKHSSVEERRLAIGEIQGAFVTVIFTRRAETIRIISARASSRRERGYYRASAAQRLAATGSTDNRTPQEDD